MAQRQFPDWAVLDIADIGNGDPNKQDPKILDPNKQQDGWKVEKPPLQSMNWLQNLFGQFIRGNNEIKLVADSYEAEAGENVILNNSAGTATLLLPAAPIDGQWVQVSLSDPYTSFAGDVSGNGKDIMEAANTSVDLDIPLKVYLFYYENASDLWKLQLGRDVGVV